MATKEQVEHDGMRLLNVAREAIADLRRPRGADQPGRTEPLCEAVSGPGESDPGEFYVTLNGVDYVMRVEAL